MITEQDAIKAATKVFRVRHPDVDIKVRAFTHDEGASWTVGFDLKFRHENVDETGTVVSTTEWSEYRALFVDGETGHATWPKY